MQLTLPYLLRNVRCRLIGLIKKTFQSFWYNLEEKLASALVMRAQKIGKPFNISEHYLFIMFSLEQSLCTVHLLGYHWLFQLYCILENTHIQAHTYVWVFSIPLALFLSLSLNFHINFRTGLQFIQKLFCDRYWNNTGSISESRGKVLAILFL